MYSQIKELLDQEEKRQHYCYDLIASQNTVSKAVAELCGSVFTNNALEGQPGNRYYNGADNADAISLLSALEGQKTFHILVARIKHTKSTVLTNMRSLLPIQGLLHD